MRLLLLLALAFGAGIVVSPMAPRALNGVFSPANAQTPAAALTPMVIDIAALKDADLTPGTNGDLRSKGLVITDNATVAVQIGNVGKHYHSKSDEIQYIIEGSGTAWLGDKLQEIRPGMLIVIPKGTHHAGTTPTIGRFKAIAIKIPPQAAGDTTFVN